MRGGKSYVLLFCCRCELRGGVINGRGNIGVLPTLTKEHRVRRVQGPVPSTIFDLISSFLSSSFSSYNFIL